MTDGAVLLSQRASARSRRVRFGAGDEDDQVLVYVHEIPSRYSPFDDITNCNKEKGYDSNDEEISDAESDSDQRQHTEGDRNVETQSSGSESEAQSESMLSKAGLHVVEQSSKLALNADATSRATQKRLTDQRSNTTAKIVDEDALENTRSVKSAKPRRKLERKRLQREVRRNSISQIVAESQSVNNIRAPNASSTARSVQKEIQAELTIQTGKVLYDRNELLNNGTVSPEQPVNTTANDSLSSTRLPPTQNRTISPLPRDGSTNIAAQAPPVASVSFVSVAQSVTNLKYLPDLRTRPSSARSHNVASGLATTQPHKSYSSVILDELTGNRSSTPPANELYQVSTQTLKLTATRTHSAPPKSYKNGFDRNSSARLNASLSRDSSGGNPWTRSFSWHIANSRTTAPVPAVHVQQLFNDFYK